MPVTGDARPHARDEPDTTATTPHDLIDVSDQPISVLSDGNDSGCAMVQIRRRGMATTQSPRGCVDAAHLSHTESPTGEKALRNVAAQPSQLVGASARVANPRAGAGATYSP
jgi:hypothetical protein